MAAGGGVPEEISSSVQRGVGCRSPVAAYQQLVSRVKSLDQQIVPFSGLVALRRNAPTVVPLV